MDRILRNMGSSVRQVDMLVGDIYGDRDYSSIGLSASTIASSFGKVIARALHHGGAVSVRHAQLLPHRWLTGARVAAFMATHSPQSAICIPVPGIGVSAGGRSRRTLRLAT